MLFLDPRVTRIFCYTEPVDCRQSHNGLTHLVIQKMPVTLRSGSLFIFFSKDRKTSKVLHWDGSGIVIFHKKLERGVFSKMNSVSLTEEINFQEFLVFFSGAQVRFDLKI